MRSAIGQIAGSQALSLAVLLPGLLLITLGTAFADIQNLGDYDEAWIVVAVQAFVAALAIFFVTGLPVRFLRGQLRVAMILCVYALTEVARTVVVQSQALQRGLIENVSWPAQVLIAVFIGPAMYGVASLAINQSHEFRIRVAELTARTSLLQTTLARTEIDAKISRREIVTSAKNAIRTALNKSLGASGRVVPSAEKIRALLDVSDDVVRPLSRELRYRHGSFSGIAEEPVRAKFHVRQVLDLASTVRPFRPLETIVIGGILAVGVGIPNAPLLVGLTGLVTLLALTFGLVAMADRVLTRVLRRLRLPARLAVLIPTYMALCIPDALAVALLNGLQDGLLLSFIVYSMFAGSLMLWYLATMSGVEKGYTDVLEEVRGVNRRLEWAVARVNARLWTDQKELSRILHNDVQGVLVATAFRMQRDLDAGIDSEVDPLAVRQEVLDALSNPATDSTPPIEIALAHEQERWAGVLEIALDVDEATQGIVNHDRDARRVILDLVNEFMVNSLKHGKARSARMWMRPTTRGTMDISLYNDGAPMAPDFTPGLGVELAYSVSVSLRMPPHLTGVELRIEIPCDGTEACVGAPSSPVFVSTTPR
jgi:hypothetical protein